MPDDRPSRRQRATTGAGLAALVISAGIFQALFESSTGPVRWVFLVIAAALAGYIPFSPPWAELHERLRRLRLVPWRRWLALGLVWTIAVGSAVALGAVLVPVAASTAERARVRLFGCPNATQLRLAVSPEEFVTAAGIVEAFELDTARRRYGCPSANIHVYPVPPQRLTDGLQQGWSPDDLHAIGPRPDLWLPGSTAHAAGVDGTLTVVATTPIVLAVPAVSLVDPKLYDLRRQRSWAELIARARELGWRVQRPDPALSPIGELATVGIYTGLEPGARPVLERDLSPPELPPGDSVDLLCKRRLADPDEALIVSEHQMVRFNAGFGLGGACAVGTRPPVQGLRAFYPRDSLAVTYPLIRLAWPDSSLQQRTRAEDFERWLTAEDGRRALNDAGLRPEGQHIRDPLSERYGVLPVSLSREQPDPVRLRETEEQRAAARRPVRVLLALDASGSMRAQTGAGGLTRFDLAKLGITSSLRRIGVSDQIGLWVFQGNGPPAQAVPLGADPAALSAALETIQPAGGTPLYRTIVDGVAALATPAGDSVGALVVLTDGEDSGSGITPDQMLAAVSGTGVKVFVVATGEASCATRAIAEVTANTAGLCVPAQASNLDSQLTGLFGVLWGGS